MSNKDELTLLDEKIITQVAKQFIECDKYIIALTEQYKATGKPFRITASVEDVMLKCIEHGSLPKIKLADGDDSILSRQYIALHAAYNTIGFPEWENHTWEVLDRNNPVVKFVDFSYSNEFASNVQSFIQIEIERIMREQGH